MLKTSTIGDNATEVLERLMTDRFSCRGFRPDPVPDEVIGTIFEMARHAASWCNTQPWDMIVTRPGTTEPFAEALTQEVLKGGGIQSDLPFPPEYRGDFLARRRAAGFALYGAVGIVRGDDEGRVRQTMENFRFFGAPHVAIMTTAEELGPYGLVDCGGFLANFLLAARAHGVDTIPQAALAQQSAFIRDYFAIPEGRQVVCGVSFGYADPDHPANSFRTERRAAEEIFRFADA
ncbi:MAG: nitroreductase [Paracoccus sp. BP8]|uniref:nitroreductase n=1 Tax=Paracoccus sp. J39 TaxID=935848 RepID=UPI0004B1E523|nr:nitroreductase [Paracoccus sp. J39]RQP08166.1 MAG: nitroreductase [Paracoccus sp. BP8]